MSSNFKARDRRNAALRSFSGAYWCLVTAVYLAINFAFGLWHISWIIFIFAAAFEGVIKGIIQLRGDDNE